MTWGTNDPPLPPAPFRSFSQPTSEVPRRRNFDNLGVGVSVAGSSLPPWVSLKFGCDETLISEGWDVKGGLVDQP